MLIGRLLTDGRLNARVKYDFNDACSVKMQTQLANEKSFSQVMMDMDLKGIDWQGQIKLGNNAFYGLNYLQVRISPSTETCHRISGMGIATQTEFTSVVYAAHPYTNTNT